MFIVFYFIPFQDHNVQLYKSEDDLEEIVNNIEDIKFSDNSSDISPEHISRPISFESEKDYCSDGEETGTGIQHTKGQKQGKGRPCFSFY